MKDSTKTGLIILLAFCLLGGAYWLVIRPGSGDARVIVRERVVKIPIESVRVDSLPAEIKWKVRTNTIIDSAEIKRLLAQNDSLLLELQRKGVEKIAVGDTLICKEDSIGRICDTAHVEYNETKKYFSYSIGFGARSAVVRDSLITLPNDDWFYLGVGLNLGAGWGNSGFSPQAGFGLQLGIKIKSF
jgi:hypothetical protein